MWVKQWGVKTSRLRRHSANRAQSGVTSQRTVDAVGPAGCSEVFILVWVKTSFQQSDPVFLQGSWFYTDLPQCPAWFQSSCLSPWSILGSYLKCRNHASTLPSLLHHEKLWTYISNVLEKSRKSNGHWKESAHLTTDCDNAGDTQVLS